MLLHCSWYLSQGVVRYRCSTATAATKWHQSCLTLCDPHGLQPTRLLRPWDSPGKNAGVGGHFLLQCMKVKSESEVTQLCPTLHDPMDCSLPGSSTNGIFQARVLEWVAITFSWDAPLITAKLIKRRQKMKGKSRDTGFLKVYVLGNLWVTPVILTSWYSWLM